MNTVEIKLDIDETILLSMKEKKTALSLYRKGKLSLGKAAQLSGYNRLDFIKKLQDEGEPIFDYDNDFVDELVKKAGEPEH